MRIDSKRCHVEVGDAVLLLSPQGRLFRGRKAARNPIAVGDRVRVRLDGEGGGSIEEVLPRTSKLSRASAGEGSFEQVLVANLDQALVVSAVADPELQPDLVDRILAGCEREGLRAVLVFNKVDLVPPDDPGPGHWRAFYEALGYRVVPASTVTGQGIDELRDLLADRLSVFCGLSGVGKSSLLNAIQPGLALAVGSISERWREGRHTTTHSSLLRLDNGGHVVDTPGIRNFGLWGVPPRDVGELWVELEPLIPQCRFADCLHVREPGCAVLAAVEDGRVTRQRYESYLEVLADAQKGRL
ncbi:MAG: ribosome small subunit-dependent GTPase A [Planctomycetota bacterium]